MSIKRRVLTVYLLTLVPLLILGLAVLFGWYSSQRDLVLSDRLNNARLVATNFETITDDIASTSRAIGESAFQSPANGSADPELVRMVENYPLHFALILDEEGRITHASEPSLLGRSVDDPAVTEVQQGSSSVIGVNRELFESTGFLMVQRIGLSGGSSGLAAQLVNPEKLSRRLGSNPIAGGAHIVDSSGQVVVVLEYPRFGRERVMWGQYDFIRTALDGKESVDFDWIFPPTGTRRVVAAVPITGIGWEAGSAIDYEIAFAPFQRSLAVAIAVAALVLIVSGLAVRAHALSLIRAVHTLSGQSEVLGRRDVEPIPIARTGDELESVSEALDRANHDLRAYIGGIETIAETGQHLSAASTSGRVNEEIIRASRLLFDATAVWVFMFNERTGTLQPLLWHSDRPGTPPSIDIAPGEGVAGKVFSTGEITIVPDINNVDGFGWRKSVSHAGIDALIEIPLLQSDKPVGVLGVFAPGVERWQLGGREIGLLRAFGAQVTIALENSRLYENERAVASTLQQALLLMPEDVAGVTFAHDYHSGTGELLVGGDFFDLFELGEDRVGILIGDVAGKGLQGAVVTSLVKDTVRAHADEPGKTPAAVVARTNRVLEKQSSSEMFVTLFLGYLDTKTGVLTYCNAGHPTAAVMHANGKVQALPATSSIVGAFADFEFEQAEVQMNPHDMLVLYTDGLTEARRGSEFFGEERLFELLSALIGKSPQVLVESLFSRVSTYAEGHLSDDLAMLVVKLEDGLAGGGDYVV